MRELGAYIDLVALIVTVGLCLLLRRPVWGVLTGLLAVAWFPLNNGVLEGPTLVSVSHDHGLTTADAGGLVAIVVGALTVWPPSTWRSAGSTVGRLLVVALVAAIGLGLAYLDTAERVSTVVRQALSFTHF